MRKLDGLRVVVTRATQQAHELADLLREFGAEPILLPVISIAAPQDPGPLREAAAQADDYQWIVFTSANAVRAFAGELPVPRGSGPARIAAVGEATAEAAAANGFTVSVVPEHYVAESLVAALANEDLKGKRVLIPRAAVARDVVPDALRARGALVDVVDAYRNVIPTGAAELAVEVFGEPLPDWVTFASSSAVTHLLELVNADVLRRVKTAVIGPVTAETARTHGLTVAAEAEVFTARGLVEAISAFEEAQRS